MYLLVSGQRVQAYERRSLSYVILRRVGVRPPRHLLAGARAAVGRCHCTRARILHLYSTSNWHLQLGSYLYYRPCELGAQRLMCTCREECCYSSTPGLKAYSLQGRRSLGSGRALDEPSEIDMQRRRSLSGEGYCSYRSRACPSRAATLSWRVEAGLAALAHTGLRAGVPLPAQHMHLCVCF